MAKKKSRSAGGGAKRSNKNNVSSPNSNAAASSSLSSSTLASSAVAVFVAIAAAGGFFGRSPLSPPSANAPYSQSLPTDPWVDIVPSVIPPKTCNDIIYKSERIGYRLFDDSIDAGEPNNLGQQAQEIYIYHEKKVVEPTLYELVEPHLYKLTTAIKERRQRLLGSRLVDSKGFTDPSIEWVFLRKYYPLGRLSKRNSLKVHTDSNMHSITLALNDNYAGGGLFVVRPKVEDENGTQAEAADEHNLHLHKVPVEYGGYRWLHEHEGLMKRQNSSKVFFPALPQGSAALINFTVPHGVAPLAEGSPMPRYALIVFYNIDSYYEEVYPLIEEFQRSV